MEDLAKDASGAKMIERMLPDTKILPELLQDEDLTTTRPSNSWGRLLGRATAQ